MILTSQTRSAVMHTTLDVCFKSSSLLIYRGVNLRFLFWNTYNNKTINQHITDIIVEKDIDIISFRYAKQGTKTGRNKKQLKGVLDSSKEGYALLKKLVIE